MKQKQEKLTLDHLTALLWLKILDDNEFPEYDELKTLGGKFNHFNVEPDDDKEAEERANMNIAVDELAEMGYIKKTYDDDDNLDLAFTSKGLEIATKLASLDRMKLKGLKGFRDIKKFLYDNKDTIIKLIVNVIINWFD